MTGTNSRIWFSFSGFKPWFYSNLTGSESGSTVKISVDVRECAPVGDALTDRQLENWGISLLAKKLVTNRYKSPRVDRIVLVRDCNSMVSMSRVIVVDETTSDKCGETLCVTHLTKSCQYGQFVISCQKFDRFATTHFSFLFWDSNDFFCKICKLFCVRKCRFLLRGNETLLDYTI